MARTISRHLGAPNGSREVVDLSGKVAIVTGSTKGLGRTMAEGLAQAGARVVVSSRKPELCYAVAEEIANATGQETLGLACHVGDWDAIPVFVEKVVQHFGRIDVLVNNAGISPAAVPVSDIRWTCGGKSSASTWKGR